MLDEDPMIAKGGREIFWYVSWWLFQNMFG